MNFIAQHQTTIMLFMSGICAILAIITPLTTFVTRKRKSILLLLELSAMLLLVFDRYSYLYRGDVSETGFVMVRISNGLVFFLSIFIPFLVTLYLKDVFQTEDGLNTPLHRLNVCMWLFAAGTVMIIVSQFTGLLYTFDAQNVYHRAPGYLLSYMIPFLIIILQISAIIQYRKTLTRSLVFILLCNTSVPLLVSIIQFFCYGLSLTNLATALMVNVFYLYALSEMGRSLNQAKQNEIDAYRRAREKEEAMFRETAAALVDAIDAKDQYTRGHSARVAQISQQIAKIAGFSDDECKEIYFQALLHDVGKIGIDDAIIRKGDQPTSKEYEQIKLHPLFGKQILANISQFPTLYVGAFYHHERYDGTGYPNGLAGTAIPEKARLIAVADAYDAMTTVRSYRAPLSVQEVCEELRNGKGTQFDPKYTDIMLELIENLPSDEKK